MLIPNRARRWPEGQAAERASRPRAPQRAPITPKGPCRKPLGLQGLTARAFYPVGRHYCRICS